MSDETQSPPDTQTPEPVPAPVAGDPKPPASPPAAKGETKIETTPEVIQSIPKKRHAGLIW